ncbi:MAG: efflux RND transporter permease subunit, partial [Gaiellaceae bacterium]
GLLMVAIVDSGSLTFGSAIALFAVFGIGTRNGILLIERFRRLQLAGEEFGPGLVLRGALDRLAPILTTALATALALTPFIVGGGIAGYELAHSMALVMVGGLVTSTLLNLFVLPALYLRFGSGFVAAAEQEQARRDLLADLTPREEAPMTAVAMQQNVQPEPGT